MGRRIRLAVLVAITASAIGGLTAPSAMAGSDTAFNGWMSAGYCCSFAPQHSINRGTTRKEGSDGWMCAQAWQPSTGSWAGESFCSTSTNNQVDKLYCACALRQIAAFAPSVGSGVNGVVRQYW